MKYIITVNKDGKKRSYIEFGNRDELMDKAYDEHDACGVSVRPAW